MVSHTAKRGIFKIEQCEMTRHIPPGNLLYQSPLIAVWFGSFGIRAIFHTAKRGDISEPVGARPAKFWQTVQNIVSYHWTKFETSQCYKSIRGGSIPHSGSDIPQRGGPIDMFFHCCVKNNDLYKCREGFLNILKNGEMTAPYRNLYRKIDFVSKMPIFSKP